MNIFLKKIIKLINNESLTLKVEFFIAILGLASLSVSQQDSWFLIFFLISLLQLFIHLILLYKLDNNFISFSIFFMIISYIFNFGHLPIKALGQEFGSNVLFPLWYVNFTIYKSAAYFVLLSQSMLFFGIFFFTKYKCTQEDTNQEYSYSKKISLKKIRIIGYICFFIGIIPTLYIDISKLILFIQGGYINTFNLNVHDFVEVIANFFNFSIFALIIGFHKNKKLANSIFISIIIYKVIMMSSGGRGEAIVFLLGLFIVWENMVNELSIKQIIILIICGYFGLVLLNFIASFRNISQFDIKMICSIFIRSLTNNQIVSALSEFGSTFSTLCFTINSKPGPTYGLNYVLPIILVLPNIGGFNTSIVNQMIFTKHINTFNQPIGGSYIAELFYSFHWLGWIFALVLGLLIGFISYQIQRSKRNKKYFSYLIFSYITPLMFFWIRGYFGAIYREYVWHVGFSIILIFLIYYLQKKYKGVGKL